MPGGVVDTAVFDEYRRDFWYGPRDQEDLLTAWAMVKHANRTGDVGLMAEAATISTRINEQLLPKLLFREMAEFAELTGIDGLMAAHSGTALAFVLDPARPGYLDRLMAARAFVVSLEIPAGSRSATTSCQPFARRRRERARPHGVRPGVLASGTPNCRTVARRPRGRGGIS